LQLFQFDRPACHELSGNTGEGLRTGAFSPDGHWLAVPDPRNIWVWELGQSPYPAALPTTDIGTPFFSSDSSRLFVVTGPIEDAHLQGWELESCSNNAAPPKLKPLTIQIPPRLSHAALAGEDLILTSAEGVRVVNLTNLASGTGEVTKVPSGKGIVSGDGRWLAVIYSYSPLVTIYQVPGVKRVAQLETRNFVGEVCFSPSGDELAV